jgi:hypothetical protein
MVTSLRVQGAPPYALPSCASLASFPLALQSPRPFSRFCRLVPSRASVASSPLELLSPPSLSRFSRLAPSRASVASSSLSRFCRLLPSRAFVASSPFALLSPRPLSRFCRLVSQSLPLATGPLMVCRDRRCHPLSGRLRDRIGAAVAPQFPPVHLTLTRQSAQLPRDALQRS